MRSVNIDLGNRSYEIKIGNDLLGDTQEFLPWIRGNQVLIVTNEIVAPIYLEKLKRAIDTKDVNEIILPDGEHTKSLTTAETIFDTLLKIPCDRDVTIVALGGGVVGDMAGFVAACYQRGVSFLQIPTTLLSQVDSSVGGKTAVNHARGKNMIGAFHQPVRVVSDITVLETLPEREFSAGMAEVIKYGVINDLEFFEWLETNMESVMSKDTEALEFAIERSCLDKAEIVERDERESGVRALLNLGHTFGHAVEAGLGYGHWLHGEAVAIGMVMAAHMSHLAGDLSEAERDRIQTLLRRANCPVDARIDLDPQRMLDLMQVDKKVQAGRVRLVLLKGIGQAYLTRDYDNTLLSDTLSHFCK